MAAPTTTARVSPVGATTFYLKDGYRSTFAFASKPGLEIWEIEVKGAGLDGGDPINTTTMWNDQFRTMRARALITLTPCTIKFAYDPIAYNSIKSLLNVEGAITDHLPDGSTYDFFGYCQKVEFDPRKEGEMPTGTMTIQPTNYDPVAHTEAAPVLTNVTGT